MNCRPHCGACCIAPSISTLKKPSQVKCIYLSEEFSCVLWNSPERPTVCSSLQPESAMCGKTREEALNYLTLLEELTSPSK